MAFAHCQKTSKSWYFGSLDSHHSSGLSTVSSCIACFNGYLIVSLLARGRKKFICKRQEIMQLPSYKNGLSFTQDFSLSSVIIPVISAKQL